VFSLARHDGHFLKKCFVFVGVHHILDESVPEKFKKKRPQADVS